ncbi:DUF159-domain-containing protein [Stereum hirsutum FP-91666 SS1]|uniref:DUF159-domain-containing protein n=1 Tax=Stereum hirsutum (strain FP-91666) TaxID=721885 RepID=UPI000444A8FC|nr:DUF159-domain-containing protein [Stereum hirsutum FP-91666 SS1]EIM84109.1 DUF159-domain-containing protein [Stereum hirsutum FP-91666 SS1]
MAAYRISLGYEHDEVRHRLSQLVDLPTIDKDWVDEEQFTPRYNIGPKGNAAILLMNGTDGGSLNDVATSRLVLRTMPWGILYHLWHHTGAPGTSKIPYFIRFVDDRVMFLAGLYNECATAADPSDITWRFTVVSTNANREMMWLKNRQPVILSTEADVKAWLDVSSGPDKEIDVNARLNLPEFIQPVYGRPDGIESAFAQMDPDIEAQSSQGEGSVQVASPSSAVATHDSSSSATATQASSSSATPTQASSSSSSSSQNVPTASTLTQAVSSQPAAPPSASQGMRPTCARARPKPSADANSTPKKNQKRKDDPVPENGKLTHHFDVLPR